MELIYNEKTVLNNFLENNKCDIKPNKLVSILIKYYYINGIEDKLVLRENILNDLYKIDNKNTRNVWINKVDKSIVGFFNGIKNGYITLDLIDVDSVDIYEEELNIIESVSQPKFKKFLFVLLVWTKVYNKFNRNSVMENPRDLLKLSKCEVGNTYYRNMMFHELKELGLILSERKKGIYKTKINYLKEEGEIAFTVDDIENAIYYYLNWSGERWIKCSECGERWIKKTNNKVRYCRDCAKKISNKQKSEYKNKVKKH